LTCSSNKTTSLNTGFDYLLSPLDSELDNTAKRCGIMAVLDPI